MHWLLGRWRFSGMRWDRWLTCFMYNHCLLGTHMGGGGVQGTSLLLLSTLLLGNPL